MTLRERLDQLSPQKIRALFDFSVWESWEKLYYYMAYHGERGSPLMNSLVPTI